jgi:protein-disulfide isomerase
MDAGVEEVRKKFGADVAFTFVHFPIPGHRFAIPAARAAECAEAQGRFSEMRTLLFAKQDSLGLKSWDAFAEEAKVPDEEQFSKCVASAAPLPRVDAGVAIGEKLRISGTPTMIINGWMYYGLQPAALESEIEARRKGE